MTAELIVANFVSILAKNVKTSQFYTLATLLTKLRFCGSCCFTCLDRPLREVFNCRDFGIDYDTKTLSIQLATMLVSF